MAILYKDKILELLNRKEIIIESTDERIPFDAVSQVTSDTIELRLGPHGLLYKQPSGAFIADTLSVNVSDLYVSFVIPLDGYIIPPGGILFASALEIVCIVNSAYAGRISSRGTFARYGISITCGRTKFPAGTPHTPSLQLVNHSPVPVRVYPFTYIAQIQIETTLGKGTPYDGLYPKGTGPTPPRLSDRDKAVSKLLADFRSEGHPSIPATLSTAIVDKVDSMDVSMPHRDSAPPLRFVASRRQRAIASLTSSLIIALCGGYFVNMITDAQPWNNYRAVSTVLAAAMIVVFATLTVFITMSGTSE